MTVYYDASAGILCTAFRIKSTVVVQVLAKPEFYLLMCAHLVIAASYKLEYFTPEDYHIELSMSLTGITGSLMTFFVVFYNGNVFARYNQLYGLTKNMNEFCLYAVSIICREIPEKGLQRKLARMLLASAFLFFFERTSSADPNSSSESSAISNEEWGQLLDLGLVNPKETAILKAMSKTVGRRHEMPSYMLLQWSMQLYRTKSPRLNELEKQYWNIRRCQDDVVELMELPMPFQYFHIMNLMMMLNLTLWAYSLALVDSYFSSVIFLFVQLVFQGIRELSVALADPYGDDDADFPLDEWMTQVYVRVSALVEDPWKVEDSSWKGTHALYKLKPGVLVVDLLCDKESSQQKHRLRKSDLSKSDEEEVYGSERTVDSDKKRTADGYQQLPQEEAPGEDDEEDDE